MKVQTYKKIKVGLVGLMMLGTVVAVGKNSMFLALMGLGLGMVILTFLKTQVKGELEDERVKGVAGRAARIAFSILMPILGLTAVALFAAGGIEEFYYVRALGIVLSYVTCLGLVIYSLAYWWFDRKFGG